jgi:hypothetical protein
MNARFRLRTRRQGQASILLQKSGSEGLKKMGVDPMFIRNLTIAVLGLGLVLTSVTGASAAAHPRRAEVNHRLAVENARIRNGVKEGTITPKEAAQLHSEVHGVRVEERADAAQHNGHITKVEQNQLNQEENAVSRDIYNAAH